MSIDERGLRAGAHLRATHEATDVEEGLDDLFATVRRRRRATGALAVAAGTAAVLIVVAVAVKDASDQRDAGPTSPPSSTVGGYNPYLPKQCDREYVTCQGQGRFTVTMPSKMTWQVTPAFNRTLDFSTNDPDNRAALVEAYRNSGTDQAAGVTVMANVRAASLSADSYSGVAVDPDAPTSAAGLATWLANRPFFVSSGVETTTVGGRAAWSVRVRMRQPDAVGPVRCFSLDLTCQPVLILTDTRNQTFVGSWGSMVSDYTFVDLPSGGTAAIWSWSFAGDRDLERNQPVVDSIRFHD